MTTDSSINFELCVVCKTSRMLCGRKSCPLLQKWSKEYSIEKPTIKKLDESFTPPSFFVSWGNYPYATAGPMLTIDRVGSESIDNSDNWLSRTQEEIVKMRVSLFRTRTRLNLKKPLDSDIIQKSQELLLGKNSVDVEVNLIKNIIPAIKLDERSAPAGPIAHIDRLRITENQTPIPAIEKSYYDSDLLTVDAVEYLGKEKIDVSTIIRVFSAGMLGREQNRKLVPTRWSITAVDDIVSKQNIERIKKFQEIGEYRVFSYNYFGNYYFILLIPDVWSFEVIETWFSGAFMNPSKIDIGLGDWEGYNGRTEYASNVTGGYYAARLAATEYLLRIQRQAQILVFREITSEYKFPLGVWVVRMGVRGAFEGNYVTADSIDSAFTLIPNYLKYPIEYWKHRSRLYELNKTQTKLDQFFM